MFCFYFHFCFYINFKFYLFSRLGIIIEIYITYECGLSHTDGTNVAGSIVPTYPLFSYKIDIFAPTLDRPALLQLLTSNMSSIEQQRASKIYLHK